MVSMQMTHKYLTFLQRDAHIFNIPDVSKVNLRFSVFRKMMHAEKAIRQLLTLSLVTD